MIYIVIISQVDFSKSRCRVTSIVALGLFGVYVFLEAFCIPRFKFSVLKVNTSTTQAHTVLKHRLHTSLRQLV